MMTMMNLIIKMMMNLITTMMNLIIKAETLQLRSTTRSKIYFTGDC